MHVKESAIEQELVAKLGELKYTLRPDIRDRALLERNFLEKFEVLNRVYLTPGETTSFRCASGRMPTTTRMPPCTDAW